MGLIVCMVFSLLPLGCHSMNVRHGAGRAGQPYVPDETAQRLKACVEEDRDSIEPGRYAVDAKVNLDEYGGVSDAATTGTPNPDIGICMRIALRDMKVGRDVIEQAALRSTSIANTETNPNRAYVGQVETVVVVTIVYVEVIVIDELLLAVGITLTATAAANMAANAASPNATKGRTERASRKPHQPVPKKWLDAGGSIQQKADGTTIFTRSDGVSVTYDKAGFPDFTPYRHPTVKDVQIEFTGSYPKDFAAADKATGITKKMREDEGYTWHHHQDGKTMQLIKKNVHQDFFHTGGMSGTR